MRPRGSSQGIRSQHHPGEITRLLSSCGRGRVSPRAGPLSKCFFTSLHASLLLLLITKAVTWPNSGSRGREISPAFSSEEWQSPGKAHGRRSGPLVQSTTVSRSVSVQYPLLCPGRSPQLSVRKSRLLHSGSLCGWRCSQLPGVACVPYLHNDSLLLTLATVTGSEVEK